MSTNTKSTKEETNEMTYDTAAFATLFNKGLERVAEVSKSSLDLAVAQNTEFLASCKNALKIPMPGLSLFDMAGSAFEGYVALQKSLLGLAVEQSTAVVNATQWDADKAKGGINALIEQSSGSQRCGPEFGSGLRRQAGQGSGRDREAATRRDRQSG